MQNIIVLLAIAGAVVFIGIRMWKTLRDPKNISCGCGCSGCGSASNCSSQKTTLPLHKP